MDRLGHGEVERVEPVLAKDRVAPADAERPLDDIAGAHVIEQDDARHAPIVDGAVEARLTLEQLDFLPGEAVDDLPFAMDAEEVERGRFVGGIKGDRDFRSVLDSRLREGAPGKMPV